MAGTRAAGPPSQVAGDVCSLKGRPRRSGVCPRHSANISTGAKPAALVCRPALLHLASPRFHLPNPQVEILPPLFPPPPELTPEEAALQRKRREQVEEWRLRMR